jgi:acetyl esterase
MRAGIDGLFGSAVREPVARVEENTAPGPAGDIPVRVYAPAERGPLPALVYFHGGGFVCGSLESHDALCRALANRARCLVMAVGYRLAPEHPFPAAPEDCFAAVRFLAQRGREFGADPARIAVAGDSAGGNLAAVTALVCRERGGPALCHQLLLYPVMARDFETASYRANADGYLLTRDTMIWFWRQYLRDPADAENPLAAPLAAKDVSGLPPATVVTAEFDPLRDEGEAYALRLARAGVPTELTRRPGLIHGFLSFPDRIDRARLEIDRLGRRLREAFLE